LQRLRETNATPSLTGLQLTGAPFLVKSFAHRIELLNAQLVRVR
jgi:hypothetical protein